MSVLKSKRKTSRLEFLHNAYQIRRHFTNLLLRDFGTKDKIRSSKFYAKINHMEPEDQETFVGLTDKYHISTIVDEYPEWIISDMRNRIQSEIRFLIRNIIQANTIYPTTESEYIDRRRYQTAAIGCCEQIIQEMQYVIETLDVDVNKYLPYVDELDREVALLRGWRKSDNRLLKAIREKEAKQIVEQEMEVERIREEMKMEKMQTPPKIIADKKKKHQKSEGSKQLKNDKKTST